MKTGLPKCEYCGASEGQIDWHHPVPQVYGVGIYLCQKHHSLIYGRRRSYPEEVSKNLEVEREKVERLVRQKVARAISLLVYYLAEGRFKG